MDKIKQYKPTDDVVIEMLEFMTVELAKTYGYSDGYHLAAIRSLMSLIYCLRKLKESECR